MTIGEIGLDMPRALHIAESMYREIVQRAAKKDFDEATLVGAGQGGYGR